LWGASCCKVFAKVDFPLPAFFERDINSLEKPIIENSDLKFYQSAFSSYRGYQLIKEQKGSLYYY